MKINFASALLDIKGNPILNGENSFTLGEAAIMALITPIDGERTPAQEKFKRAQLAQRVFIEPGLDYSVDDVALIKKLIGDGFVKPEVVFAAWNAIENGNGDKG